jgi:hypothetical protein
MSKLKIEKVTTGVEAAGRERSMANLRKGNSRKGIPNKNTKAIKEMILGALDKAGGEDYLFKQAEENPSAFMQLIGKVLPTELKNADAGGFVVHVTTGVPRD